MLPLVPLSSRSRHNFRGCWGSRLPKTQRRKDWVGMGFLPCILPTPCPHPHPQSTKAWGCKLSPEWGWREGQERGGEDTGASCPCAPPPRPRQHRPCPDSLGSGLGPLEGRVAFEADRSALSFLTAGGRGGESSALYPLLPLFRYQRPGSPNKLCPIPGSQLQERRNSRSDQLPPIHKGPQEGSPLNLPLSCTSPMRLHWVTVSFSGHHHAPSSMQHQASP